MATPRKHWFKVADSVLWDGWSDAELATMVRLQAYLNTRWARDGKSAEEAGRATLDLSSARLICRRTHRADCERALRALGARMTLSVVVVGECFEVNWPKWAEFQGLATREPSESRPRASLSGTQTQTPPQDARLKEEKSPPAAPAPRKRSSTPKTLVPDELSQADADRVVAWASKQSPPITSEQLAYGWRVFRAQARSKGYAYADHAQAFQNALGATGSAWALKGYGQSSTGEAESPAQARARRTKEAGAKAYEMIQARKQQLGLMQIEGGGR